MKEDPNLLADNEILTTYDDPYKHMTDIIDESEILIPELSMENYTDMLSDMESIPQEGYPGPEEAIEYYDKIVCDGSGSGNSGTKGPGEVKNVYNSIKDSPNYPQGFKEVQNGTKKVNVNNGPLLDELRKVEPGEWKRFTKMVMLMARKHQFIIFNTQKLVKYLMLR